MPISRRPIADQSPTSLNESHALILTKSVGDRSATDRRLVGDLTGGPVCDQISRSLVFEHVCDQISRSQVFEHVQKPGSDWFGRRQVPD